MTEKRGEDPTRRRAPAAGSLLFFCLLLACTGRRPPDGLVQEREAEARTAMILAINDVYRIEGVEDGTRGGLARLRSLRAELEEQHPDLLLLLAGDFLFPSLLSRQFRGKQMVDVLNYLDGDGEAMDPRMFVTFGNHEFDRPKLQDAPLLDKRIRESQFRWLGTDLTFASGEDGQAVVAEPNLIRRAIVESGGLRIGLFSLTIPSDIPDYVVAISDPVETARRLSAELRDQGAEVVVALTHLTIQQDLAVLEALGAEGPDLIVGGHEHNRQQQPVGSRWVLKADAEARTATVIRLSLPPSNQQEDGTSLQKGGTSLSSLAGPTIRFEHRPLGPTEPIADAEVREVVQGWIERHDRLYCRKQLEQPPGCLDEILGRSRTELVGEELEIRRFETNLGNWLVDKARLALTDAGAEIAVFNSGSFRLNQDLPPGPITRRHVEEIFQYPSELKLVRITGAQLRKALEHSVSDWTGNGHWLQVSGLAFRHDPGSDTVDRITYLAPEGPRPIRPEDTFVLALGGYIAGGGDGYELFEGLEEIPYGEPVTLKDLVIRALQEAGDQGISPAVEGRICNTQRPGRCLAKH